VLTIHTFRSPLAEPTDDWEQVLYPISLGIPSGPFSDSLLKWLLLCDVYHIFLLFRTLHYKAVVLGLITVTYVTVVS
jgi:hypothetical protein